MTPPPFLATRPCRANLARRLAGAACAALIAATVWAVPSPAPAQEAETRALLNRLERLERDIQTLNQYVYKGGEAPTAAAGTGSGAAFTGPVAARMNVRLDELEGQLRALTGQVEETGHQVRQMKSRLDKLVTDIDFRLSALEGRVGGSGGAAGGSMPGGAPQAAPTPGGVSAGPAREQGILGTVSQEDLAAVGEAAGQAHPPATAQGTTAPETAAPEVAAAPPPAGAVLPDAAPEEQYKYAQKLLFQNRYDDAEVALSAFIDAHPGHALTGNARYWLGETYYVRGDYAGAARTFFESYEKDPKGNKGADSLLKLGMALARLDKTKEACATFDKLANDFGSNLPGAIGRVADRERQAAGC